MDSSHVTAPTRRRSKAWVYYTLLAFAGFVTTCAGHPVAILGTAIFAAYAVYLYRGGRFVVWFW